MDRLSASRLSANALTTFRWSLEEDLHYAGEAGYGGVGLWTRKVRDFGEERAVDLVRESGLGVSCVSWEGGFTGADAVSADDNIAAACDTLALCAALGAGCLTIYSGGRNGHTARHAERLLHAALDRLLPVAEEVGVPLALEPLHPRCADNWTILTNLPDALRLVRAYDTPALRLAIDTYHFPVGEADWPLLAEAAEHLAVVHLGDLDEPHGVDQARVPLGEGSSPLAGIVRTLVAAGYLGFFDVKLTGPAFDAMDYHALLRHSRRQFAKLGVDRVSVPSARRADTCRATLS